MVWTDGCGCGCVVVWCNRTFNRDIMQLLSALRGAVLGGLCGFGLYYATAQELHGAATLASQGLTKAGAALRGEAQSTWHSFTEQVAHVTLAAPGGPGDPERCGLAGRGRPVASSGLGTLLSSSAAGTTASPAFCKAAWWKATARRSGSAPRSARPSC
jgi:hypothetical protein